MLARARGSGFPAAPRIYRRITLACSLWLPERTEAERQAAAAALERARRHGWAPPMAWDDDVIDDPAGRPAHGWKPRRSPRVRHSADLAEDTAFLRQHGGYRHAPVSELALRLDVSTAWLQSALSRARRAQRARSEVADG